MEKKVALTICQLCAVDFTVEKFLTPLIDGMTNEGWCVTTVCSDGKAIKKLRDRGYKIHTIPIARSMNPFKAIRSIILLYKYFKISNFDIIHVHTPVASLLARIAAKLSCKSFVIYTAHGFYFHDEMNKWVKRFFVYLEKFAGKYTHLLFCQSKEDAEEAVKESIMIKENVFAIGNGVDVEKYDFEKYAFQFEQIRKEVGIPLNAKVIGIVARMVKEKGYQELLTAAINLHPRHENLYFLLVGGKLDTDHNKGINEILKKTKKQLGNKLVDLGLRNDVPRLISIMDIFCLPSYREGMPRTIIEAMFLKKPVVTTNIRGCREEVVHGKSGFLVPIANPEALTESLEYLLNNTKIANQMGEYGFEIAKNNYDEKKVVKFQIETIKSRLKF